MKLKPEVSCNCQSAADESGDVGVHREALVVRPLLPQTQETSLLDYSSKPRWSDEVVCLLPAQSVPVKSLHSSTPGGFPEGSRLPVLLAPRDEQAECVGSAGTAWCPTAPWDRRVLAGQDGG